MIKTKNGRLAVSSKCVGCGSKKSRYETGLVSMVYKCFDKKSKGTGIENEIKENQQLANELNEPIIRKY